MILLHHLIRRLSQVACHLRGYRQTPTRYRDAGRAARSGLSGSALQEYDPSGAPEFLGVTLHVTHVIPNRLVAVIANVQESAISQLLERPVFATIRQTVGSLSQAK